MERDICHIYSDAGVKIVRLVYGTVESIESIVKALFKLFCFFFGIAKSENVKFIAACPACYLIFGAAVRDDASQGLDGKIALGVTVNIIYLLEPIHIYHKCSHRAGLLPCLIKSSLIFFSNPRLLSIPVSLS